MEWIEARNLLSGTYRFEYTHQDSGYQHVSWVRGKTADLIADGYFFNYESAEVRFDLGDDRVVFQGDEARDLLKCGVRIENYP